MKGQEDLLINWLRIVRKTKESKITSGYLSNTMGRTQLAFTEMG